MSSIRSAILALFFALTLAACATAPPEGLRPVTSFDINRYLGQWYEIARLDHSFERGMSDVSAASRSSTGVTTRSGRRGRKPSAVPCSSATAVPGR
jgi:lipocalin